MFWGPEFLPLSHEAPPFRLGRGTKRQEQRKLWPEGVRTSGSGGPQLWDPRKIPRCFEESSYGNRLEWYLSGVKGFALRCKMSDMWVGEEEAVNMREKRWGGID